MLILLFFVSIAAFALVSMAPLDPLQTNVGQAAMGSMSPEQIERLRLYWGEGIPPLKRYLAWAGDFIRGNMGISLLYHQPVAKVIQVRFASSVWLMAAAWILSGVTGVILGMTAGARKGSLTDRVISAYALVTLIWLMEYFCEVLKRRRSSSIGASSDGTDTHSSNFRRLYARAWIPCARRTLSF